MSSCPIPSAAAVAAVVFRYVNRETHAVYAPHNDAERQFVYTDTPTNALLKGGEGAGKSVAGVVKMLEDTNGDGRPDRSTVFADAGAVDAALRSVGV